MATIKNRPREYVKRADLPGRIPHVKKLDPKPDTKREKRNFAAADIDAGFYFSIRPDAGTKKR